MNRPRQWLFEVPSAPEATHHNNLYANKEWLFDADPVAPLEEDSAIPVLSLDKLKMPGLPEITLTPGSNGQYEGFFREPLSSYNGEVKVSGRVQIEESGSRRGYDYDQDRSRWPMGKAWTNVEVGGAISSSGAGFSSVDRKGTFTTSTWISYQPYLVRRLVIQAIVESKNGKRFGTKAVVELIDLAGFLAIVDSKEKTRPSGQTHLQFLASVRKIYHGNSREPQFVGPFNYVLYRHRDVKPLFTFCTPEEESLPLKLRPKYCNPAEKAAEERLRLYKILYDNGEWLEIGHVLCGIEGSPKQEPNKDQNLPRPIRPDIIVTWSADLGSAIQSYINHYWLSTDRDGNAIDKNDPLDLNHYLVRDASRSDLIGDIDGINIGGAYDSSRSLAENLNAYYGKKSRRRYHEFIANSKNDKGELDLPLLPGKKPPKLSKQARQKIARCIWLYLNYLWQLGHLYYGNEPAKRKRVDDIMRVDSNTLPLSVEIEKVVDYFVRFLEDGLALEQRQGVISQPEIEDLEMNRQSQWLFEAPVSLKATHYNNPYASLEFEDKEEEWEGTDPEWFEAEVDTEGLEQLGQSDIDQAIRAAKSQMQVHFDLQGKYAAGAGKTNDGMAARKEIAKYWEWSRERDFLEGLKAVYESQAGVPLSYTRYPVTKVDPNTGKSGKDNPWRPSTKRQVFQQIEADGSFCLGASRAMAFRALFGLDKPSNRAILTDLKKKIEAAKDSGDTNTEAKLIISRIVSHSHDPGSVKQFNQDLASRYGIKNTIIRSASRSEAFDALKLGAPIIADLEGGWHWVLVQKSPQGQLWANDPLTGSGVRKISSNELGSRFELIVDAKTGNPITPSKAEVYQK
jgi:hypothetical protein